MYKRNSASKIELSSYDDLFGNFNMSSDNTEQIQYIPISELHSFKGHPFKVLDDDKMSETVESINKYGVLLPGIVRSRSEGGFEIISGHRRKRACELAGKNTMPVFVHDYTDDEATVIMVDSNIQREDILPSEKAKAYKMKFDAIKHQGSKEGKHSLNEIGEVAGESGKTVQRYIWLSRLSDELLEMVDKKKLGIVQGIDISFLSEKMQQCVLDVINRKNTNMSVVQSEKIKEYAKNGELTPALVEKILSSITHKERKVIIKAERINEYFSEEYSRDEIVEVILRLLEQWKKGDA